MGFEVGTQGWGDAKLSYNEAENSISRVSKISKDYGIFIWAYFKENVGTVSVKQILDLSKKYE